MGDVIHFASDRGIEAGVGGAMMVAVPNPRGFRVVGWLIVPIGECVSVLPGKTCRAAQIAVDAHVIELRLRAFRRLAHRDLVRVQRSWNLGGWIMHVTSGS